MKYYLMHKNKIVLSLLLNHDYLFEEIQDIYNERHIPLGISKGKDLNIKVLNAWWNKRCIPDNRDGFKKVLKYLNKKDLRKIVIENHGFSLTDKYWIKSENENITWDKCNFYINRFSYDMGNIIFGDRHLNPDDIDFFSPDLTTNGKLRKAWRIKDNKRYLCKYGSFPYLQEPFNEVIASKLLEKLNIIPYVSYSLTLINKQPCSICENFLDENTEFISAYNLYHTKKRENDVSIYNHLIERCNFYKIPDAEKFIDGMLLVDYLMVNTDRHLGNFGFLRDANTLEFLGPAPLFDNGTSLWNMDNDPQIENILKVSRPFSPLWSEQMTLYKNLNNVNLKKIENFDKVIADYYKKSNTISQERIDLICREFRNNMKDLENYLEKNEKNKQKDAVKSNKMNENEIEM